MSSQKLPVPSNLPRIPVSRRMTCAGEWAVDEMTVKVISLNRAVIYYRKYVINAYTYEKFVDLHWWERRRGRKLQEKIQEVYDKLKLRLIRENEVIREMKQIEKGILR